MPNIEITEKQLELLNQCVYEKMTQLRQKPQLEPFEQRQLERIEKLIGKLFETLVYK